MYAAKVKARLQSRPPDCPDVLMIEIPNDLMNKKTAVPMDKANPEKAAAAPLFESDAPPPPPEPLKGSMPVPQWGGAANYGDFSAIDMVNPVRLQVLSWEDSPVTPRAGMEPTTPRADGAQASTTPRGSGILTITAPSAEVARGDAQVLKTLFSQ